MRVSEHAACGSYPLPPAVKAAEPVLLYAGTGTTPSDVSAIEGILKSLNIGYLKADQNQLDAMTEPQLGGYTLLIVPGGVSRIIGENISANATATIHNAVAQYGLCYLGICAGAFFGGASIYNGLDLTSGVSFDLYADEFKGIHLEPVKITRAATVRWMCRGMTARSFQAGVVLLPDTQTVRQRLQRARWGADS
jgi:hypothetical protein